MRIQSSAAHGCAGPLSVVPLFGCPRKGAHGSCARTHYSHYPHPGSDVNTVHAASFLTLHYRLAGPDGADLINTFHDKPATLSLGMGQLTPAIEAHLIGLPEGAHRSFDLPGCDPSSAPGSDPGSAFGPRNPDLLQRVKLSLLHELGDPAAQYSPGDVVQFPTPDGQGSYAGVVREAGPDWLLFDFNHPLAGQPVRFEVKLLGVM